MGVSCRASEGEAESEEASVVVAVAEDQPGRFEENEATNSRVYEELVSRNMLTS